MFFRSVLRRPARIPLAMFSLVAPALGVLSLPADVAAAPACDERIDIANPDRIPFQWVVAQRHDNDDDGDFDFRSTGTLVGPHLVLTCGHCVYDRAGGFFAPGSFTVIPAMYQDDATGALVYPHGSRVVSEDQYKLTNGKWTDTSYTPQSNVDYGALEIVCPFEDITTYMPLVFDYQPSFVNMSGYPTEDLPTGGSTLDQWRDSGDVYDVLDRQLNYEPRSTGGASGAPVWVYDAANGRRQVGVNVAHSSNVDCDGIASRLVWNNEGLIESWLEWEPTWFERIDNGCGFVAQPVPFAGLLQRYAPGGRPLLSAEQLRLRASPPNASLPPSQRVYQYIENTLYSWDEHVDGQGLRSLVMQKPEVRPLSLREARVLLTASQGWQQQVASGKHTETHAAGPAERPVRQPGVEAISDRPDDSLDKSSNE